MTSKILEPGVFFDSQKYILKFYQMTARVAVFFYHTRGCQIVGVTFGDE